MLRPTPHHAFGLLLLAAVIAFALPSQAREADDWTLQRGDWTTENGTLACKFDPAKYEQYANHGPIAVRTFEATDAEMSVTFTLSGDAEGKPTTRPRVVLTFDGDRGHVLRVILFPETAAKVKGSGSRAIAWPQGWKKGEKTVALIPNGKLPRFALGEETTVSMQTTGEDGVITVNGEVFEVSHPALARTKTNGKISFAFGDLTIADITAGPLEAATE